MALASSAHIKLGSHEFYLAEDVPGHYLHSYERLAANRIDISGAPGKQGLRSEILNWAFSDWSGGEGLKWYDPERPNVYYQGQANGRVPGELAPPPARSQGTFATQAAPDKIMFAPANGKLYMATGNVPTAAGLKHFAESSDGTTWTGKDAGFGTSDKLTAMASDQTYVYLSSIDGTSRKLRRYEPGAASSAFADTAGNSTAFFGMAFLPIATGGRLYGWNGKRLFEYDTTASLPVDSNVVFETGVDTLPSGAKGGIVAGENSVVFYLSAEGRSQVWEYGLGAGAGARPLWRPPAGFVVKDICYTLGTIIFVGNYSNKKAAFAYSLVTRQANFLNYIRPNASLGVADISPGYGAEVLFLSTNGHLFSYDLAAGAYSEVDDASAISGTWAGCTTYKDLRLAGVYNSTTTTVYAWGADDGSLSTSQSSFPEHPAWDFGLPEEDKVLLGFHCHSTSLDSTNKIRISYDTDESGSYTDLTDLTSGRTNYVTAPATPDFRTLRFKVKQFGSAKVFSVTARAMALSQLETWDLIIDLTRLPTSGRQDITSATRIAQARQILLNAIEGRDVIAFRDGYGFDKAIDTAWDEDMSNNAVSASTAGYRQYSVVIMPVQDEIENSARGRMRVRLVSIAP